jgi:4-hydroxy-tetrahydrodipicolinate reductase
MMDYAVKTGTAAVICTTGLSEEQIHRIELESAKIAVLRSANMSLGVNLMRKLIADAHKTLGEAFDIEIIETHHNRKKDAPSGTALMLAEAIKDVDDTDHPYVYGRSEKDRKRSAGEIGFHSIRGGTVVGEHEVRFLGTDEELSILHRASSKRVFATGAIKAASFLTEQPNGLYSMDDLVAKITE